MKDQRKTEIKVGVMTIAGIIILIWIIGWAKNFNLTAHDKTVFVKFSNVSGLEIGDYVTVNGVRQGYVEDFNLEVNDVIVKLSIDKDVDLREDAKFAISMLDLMGGKKVVIEPGYSSTPLDYNRVQNGIFYADIPEVMSMLGTVQGDLFDALKDIKTTLTSLNNYLTDKELNKNIKSSLSNINTLTEKINVMLEENRAGIKKLTDNTIELTDKANQFIAENKNSINKSVAELLMVLQKTDTLLSRVNEFSFETKQKQNSLGKILYDKEMYKNLTESVERLNELTKIILKQLKEEGLNIDAHINLF